MHLGVNKSYKFCSQLVKVLSCIWLKKELKYLLDKYLSKEMIEECDLVHYAPVALLLEDFFNGKDYLFNRLWALVILHKWCKEKNR